MGGGRARHLFLLIGVLLFLTSHDTVAHGASPELILEKSSFTQFMSPVVADADNDGQNEVLAGSFEMWETNNNNCDVVKYDWGSCHGQAYCPTWKAGIPIEQSHYVVIAVGNLDLDPDNEVVVTNTSPHDVNSNGRLTIWKHTTGDNYDSCWSMTVGEGITDLAIGDCDHDGQNELVVAYQYYWRGVKIFKRVGDCQYQESYSIYTGKDNYSVTVADCDNDDSLEIVITPSVWGTSVDVWEYRNASYQQVWSYSIDSGSPYTIGAWATVGDVDNDGENEILVTADDHRAGSGIYVFEHTVGDSYELAWSDTGSEKGCHYPFIADIFNDGGNEFLVVRYDTLLVYSYNGSSYDTILVQQLPDQPTGGGGVYVGDADNDGYNEVVTSGKTLTAYEGSGTNLSLEKSSLSQFMSPVVADADNDGQNEVLAGNFVEMWETNNNGCDVVKYDWGNCSGQAYCPTWKAGIPIEQSHYVVIAVGNLDLDPDNEVVVTNTSPHDVNSNGRLTIWKHTTGDDYDSCWSMTVGEHIGDLAIGDCDHDGENELVVSYNYYWRGFKVFERVGECQYAESFSYITGKDNHTVAIADCDNDDSLEIIITSSVWGTEVCVWEYRDGAYQEVWCYSFDTGPPYTLGAQAQVGDTDNDAENEILVAVHGSGTVANRGVYVFEHAVGDSYYLYWSETGPEKEYVYPFIGDIFNDGDNEFLVVRHDTLLVYSFTGSGYGVVLVEQLVDRPTGVYVGDADNDGKNEVIVGGNSILAYEGKTYVCGDCNGDGLTDIADVICKINYLFLGTSLPCPPEVVDHNGDGVVNIADVIAEINYLFLGATLECPLL